MAHMWAAAQKSAVAIARTDNVGRAFVSARSALSPHVSESQNHVEPAAAALLPMRNLRNVAEQKEPLCRNDS